MEEVLSFGERTDLLGDTLPGLETWEGEASVDSTDREKQVGEDQV